MERSIGKFMLVTFFFFFSILIHVTVSSNISAIFAIGDSTIDAGNNDYIGTWLRSDHAPYGRDLEEGYVATGRFSDGKLITDFVVSELGLKDLLPAYLDPKINDRDLLTGVSFASAGSGFDDRTAAITDVIPMSKQMEYLEGCIGRIRGVMGGVEEGDRIVNDAVFVISAGTNDLLWNYYDIPTRKIEYTTAGYQDFLLQHIRTLVKKIYSLGGRRIAIAGLPPIGCLPIQRTRVANLLSKKEQRVCIDQQNEDAMAYNLKLQTLISLMPASLPGIKVAYADTYNQLTDMILNPNKYGFEETSRGCCGSGLVEMGSMCNRMSSLCSDASKYMFWDCVHPTQAVYQFLANYFLQTVLPLLTT